MGVSGRPLKQKDKDNFLVKLHERKGIVTLACKDIGISPVTYHRWKQDKVFIAKAEEIIDGQIGTIAEDRLSEAIIVNKDMAMVRFYLGARSWKYKQKAELEHTGNLNINIINYGDKK